MFLFFRLLKRMNLETITIICWTILVSRIKRILTKSFLKLKMKNTFTTSRFLFADELYRHYYYYYRHRYSPKVDIRYVIAGTILAISLVQVNCVNLLSENLQNKPFLWVEN